MKFDCGSFAEDRWRELQHTKSQSNVSYRDYHQRTLVDLAFSLVTELDCDLSVVLVPSGSFKIVFIYS